MTPPLAACSTTKMAMLWVLEQVGNLQTSRVILAWQRLTLRLLPKQEVYNRALAFFQQALFIVPSQEQSFWR